MIPTFCIAVECDSLDRVGLRRGDMVLCDEEKDQARFVIATWDGLAHICTDIGNRIFDEATGELAPDGAEIIGRVVGLYRPMVSAGAGPQNGVAV